MRLLQRDSAGNLRLTKDLVGDDPIPQYAILSHTWGASDDEFSFADLVNDTGREKPGYLKMTFCAEQAALDGLDYFWIDTCCVNKANHTELSQAINSMHRWYQNSARCYVYLSDVSSSKRDADDPLGENTWERAFRCSRWFKRGWTLQ